MLSLVLMILFVHIAIYLVNTIGASTIDLLVRLLMTSILKTSFQMTPYVTWDSRLTTYIHIALATLPESADLHRPKCPRAATIEGRSHEAEARDEQHELPR